MKSFWLRKPKKIISSFSKHLKETQSMAIFKCHIWTSYCLAFTVSSNCTTRGKKNYRGILLNGATHFGKQISLGAWWKQWTFFPGRNAHSHSQPQLWYNIAGFKWWVQSSSEFSPQSPKSLGWEPLSSNPTTISNVQMRKLKYKGVKRFVRTHTRSC